MKKKQPNLNLRKELLKSYLLKLTNNKVALIENDVIRAENLTYSICQNRTVVDLGEVKLTVSPYSYNKKKVYSSVFLQLFKKEEEVWNYRTRLYANQYYLNFVSELNRVQIEKLIKALKPIIGKIDKKFISFFAEDLSLWLSSNNLPHEIEYNLYNKLSDEFIYVKVNELYHNSFEYEILDELNNSNANKFISYTPKFTWENNSIYLKSQN